MNRLFIRYTKRLLLAFLAVFSIQAEIIAQAPTRAQLTPINTTGNNNKSGAFRVVLYIPQDTLNTTDSGAIAYVDEKLMLKKGSKWISVGSARQMNDSTFIIGGDTIKIPGVGNTWGLSGNLTDDPTNTFIGTLDGYPLRFRTADLLRMVLDSASAKLSIVDGTDSLQLIAGPESMIVSSSGPLVFKTSENERLRITEDGSLQFKSISAGTSSDYLLSLNPDNLKVRVIDYSILGGNLWSLTGNTGTNPSSNFIGTTDEQPVVIKTNNIERGRFLSNGQFYWGPGATSLSVLGGDMKSESPSGSIAVVATSANSATSGGVLNLGQYGTGPITGTRYGAVQFWTTHLGNSALGAAIEGINKGGGDPNTGVTGGAILIKTKIAGSPNQPPTEMARFSDFGFFGLRQNNTAGVDPWFGIHVRRSGAGGDNTIASSGYAEGVGGGNFWAGKYGVNFLSGVLPTGEEELGKYGYGVGSGTSVVSAAIVGGASGAWSSSSQPSFISFKTTAPGSTTMAEVARINQLGNVGIGTNNPLAKLHVITDNDDSGVVITSTHPSGGSNLRVSSKFAGITTTTTDDLAGIAQHTFTNSTQDGNSTYKVMYSPGGKTVIHQMAPGVTTGATGWREMWMKNSGFTSGILNGDIGSWQFGKLGTLGSTINTKGYAVESYGSIYADSFMVFNPRPSAPPSPVNGMMYYSNPDHKFYGRVNGSWVDLGATGGGVGISGFTDGNGFLGNVSGGNLSLTTSLLPGSIPFIDGAGRLVDDNGGLNYNFGNLGIGMYPGDSKLHIQTSFLGPYTTSTEANSAGITLSNLTQAASGTQQASPPIVFEGYGYGTTDGTSQSVKWRLMNLPVQGTTSSSIFKFQHSHSNGTFTEPFTLTSSGSATFTDRMVITKGAGVTPDVNNLLYLGRNEPGNFYPLFIIEDRTNDGYAQFGYWGKDRKWNVGVGNGPSSFFGVADKYYILDATSNIIRFVIDTDGNTGIGTNAPSSKLHVNGTATIVDKLTLGNVATGTHTDSTLAKKANGEVVKVAPDGGVKTYVAILTAISSGVPTATVIKNTLGGSIIWSRDGEGQYSCSLVGAFTANKTFITIGNCEDNVTDGNRIYGAAHIDTTNILLNSFAGGNPIDGFTKLYIKIEIYP